MNTQKIRKNNIPKVPRLERAKKIAIEYLNYADIRSLPINFFTLPIPDMHKWIIIEYEEAKKIMNIFDPLNIVAKKADARTLLKRGNENYVTVYKKSQTPERDYYTLAHELGHIVLCHLTDFKQTALSRGGLDAEQYSVLEHEADLFAAELLMPYPVLRNIHPNTPADICKICKTSKFSSARRFSDLKGYYLPNYLKKSCTMVAENFSDFINKRYCVNCNSGFISHGGDYCSICGNKTKKWGDVKVIYNSIKLNEKGKAKVCPICKNENTNLRGEYCQICGINLVNKCTKCNTPLTGDARFCEFCGAKSTYLENGLLQDYKSYKNSNKFEMPF